MALSVSILYHIVQVAILNGQLLLGESHHHDVRSTIAIYAKGTAAVPRICFHPTIHQSILYFLRNKDLLAGHLRFRCRL